jgi:hypothetical protein
VLCLQPATCYLRLISRCVIFKEYLPFSPDMTKTESALLVSSRIIKKG